jgi:hypothetical protein
VSESIKALDIYNDLSSERLDYLSKARRIEFNPIVPRLPKNTSDSKLLTSTLSGFIKRFNNWKSNYKKFKDTRDSQIEWE